MSMKEYPINSHGAFYIDEEAAAYILLALDKQGKDGRTVPEAIQAMSREEFCARAKDGTLAAFGYGMPRYLEDEIYFDWVCACHRFVGNVSTIREAKEYTEQPIDKDFDETTIHLLECEQEMSLFKKAYNSVGELAAEYRYRLKDCDFPDDFDWYAHIVDVEGCTYG